MSITYPVDVENTRWSVVRISTNEIERHNKPWPRADGEEIVNLDADLVPLLEVQEARPVFDPEVERLERTTGVIDIPNNTHTHGWQIVPLNQEELDAKAELAQAKAAYQALKAHSGTAGERATRLENVVAYMLREQYGS